MRKRKQDKKTAAILDTSIHFERLKYPDIEKKIDELMSKYRLFSSSYAIYEFKVGLILSLINYFHMVGIEGIAKAKAKWVDKWGREPKYKDILEIVMDRLNDSIATKDTQIYLRQVETAIFTILKIFDDKISGTFGSFIKDEIINYKISTRESYKGFLDLYYGRKKLPMVDFWKSNDSSLKKLVASTELKNKYKDLHKRLVRINTDVKDCERLISVNKGVGDAIISIDYQQSHTLLTFDSSFDCLCPTLGKKHLRLPKTK